VSSCTTIAPHEQRRFLMVAFHPYGSDVCQLLGMTSPSLDVDEVERRAALDPWQHLMSGSGEQRQHRTTTPQIIGLAHLYEEAAASLINNDHPSYHRSLGEDLVSFFIALVSLGGDQ
jgi:hypothetical protein